MLQNPLKAPLHIVSTSDVGATLGQDAINSGIKASISGVAFVSAFMLVYYLLAGLAANVALITNIIILLGVMCSVGTTFTLPGIAGGVLTVGMAVDANVLIYERIREELAKGKSLRGAIEAGYARAFGTIFDSHVTTLISSIILILMGTGEIKGFGVTLTIGVAASLFTALVVTRLIFNFLMDRNWIKSLPMLHIIRSAKIDFMSIRHAAGAVPRRCSRWLRSASASRAADNCSALISSAATARPSASRRKLMKKTSAPSCAHRLKRTRKSSIKRAPTWKLCASPAPAVPPARWKRRSRKNSRRRNSWRSATRKWAPRWAGKSSSRRSSPSLMAMFGILVYVAFRYEFFFAVAAVIAVLHDVLFAIGAYCIANAISGRQFNATVVAAVLTIIGFSINDKIVIFDRIREDLRLGMRGTFKEIINQALNQTLSRTIITSGTVLIATGCLFVWGGGVINDFAFTFLVGIVVGTYSSIYIASTIVLRLHKGERPNIGGSAVTLQNAPAAKGADPRQRGVRHTCLTWRAASLPPGKTVDLSAPCESSHALRPARGSLRRAGKPGSTAGKDARRYNGYWHLRARCGIALNMKAIPIREA